MSEVNEKILKLRKEYGKQSLDEDSVGKNPVALFEQWMNEALSAEVMEANAMSLATVDPNGKPSIRMVLLRGFGPDGFQFFTNYESRKGKAIGQNPYGAFNFFWPELERQVRIEGKIAKLSEAESDEYFNSRPYQSRLGAWASPQSQKISGRLEILEKIPILAAKFVVGVPRPPHWGGYRLLPERFEFWQGRPSRLHDRIQYEIKAGSAWEISRLAP